MHEWDLSSPAHHPNLKTRELFMQQLESKASQINGLPHPIYLLDYCSEVSDFLFIQAYIQCMHEGYDKN